MATQSADLAVHSAAPTPSDTRLTEWLANWAPLGMRVSSSEPRMRRVTVMATRLNLENLDEADERHARSGVVDGCRGVRSCPNLQNRW